MPLHADPTQSEKRPTHRRESVAHTLAQAPTAQGSTAPFVDQRPETITQRKLQMLADNRPQLRQLHALQDLADQRPVANPISSNQASADSQPASIVQGKFIYEGFKGTPKEGELATAVEALIKGDPVWSMLNDEKNISIYITVDDSISPNPAAITNPIKDTRRKGHWVFVLKIRRWFIEANPVGHVIGALNHEIGVHALPRIKQVKENSEAELNDKPLPHKEEDMSSKKKGGIDDHERAMTKGSNEFKQYLNLALNSAETLKRAGKEKEGTDVLFAYLMDVAAMAPDGDKGIIVLKTMIPNPKRQETYRYILGRYQGLVGQLPPEWQAKMPKMSVKDVERVILDFRAKIPKKTASLAAIAILLLICLIIYIVRTFLL